LTTKSSIPGLSGVEGFFFAKKGLSWAAIIIQSRGGIAMPANSQQGTYLGTSLAGFTALTAGLVVKGGIGILVALVGAVLLLVSAAGFYKIKSLE
jgi:hypothetical protein